MHQNTETIKSQYLLSQVPTAPKYINQTSSLSSTYCTRIQTPLNHTIFPLIYQLHQNTDTVKSHYLPSQVPTAPKYRNNQITLSSLSSSYCTKIHKPLNHTIFPLKYLLHENTDTIKSHYLPSQVPAAPKYRHC